MTGHIRGVMVPNDYKWYYNIFGMDCTCPKDIQSLIDQAAGEDLEIYVNSPGGVIDVGSEIYTLLRSYQGNVTFYITGEACSAASVAVMAGTVKMSPTALMMVHCVSTGARGNHATMEHTAGILRAADEALCTAYMAKTGMSQEEALEMMEKETWLNAKEAKERGLVDEIMFQEEQGPLQLTAGLFQLPSQEKLNNAKKLLAGDDSSAFMLEKAQAELNLLKLGGRR